MFISNTTSHLEERLRQLLKTSKELNILVGFFYFSGTEALYQELHNNPEVTIKILVGLNVDTTVHDIVEYGTRKPATRAEQKRLHYQSLSPEDTQKTYLESLRTSLNNKAYDTQEFYQKVHFFLDLIDEGRLEIRKTADPNHAKLYIFQKQDGSDIPRFVITGSSNLTESGLNTQHEFNVELREDGQTEQAQEFFQGLWEEAIPLTEDDVMRTEIKQVIQNQTLVAEVTPYELYIKVLDEYIKAKEERQLISATEILEKNNYQAYRYQLDAVKQALATLDTYNGVIIADVVGLGKSIVSSLIIHELPQKKGIIVTPPALIPSWEQYAEDFDFKHWDIISSGSIEKHLDKYQSSQYKDEYQYVLIDEAHTFRNVESKNHELLNILCKGRKVLILTATPFNNTPQDFFALIQLFDIPKQSNITLQEDLAATFARYEDHFQKLSDIQKLYTSPKDNDQTSAKKKYRDYFKEKDSSVDLDRVKNELQRIAQEVRAVIEPVLIRRNRQDLLHDPEYSKDMPEMSRINDPEPQFFTLSQDQSALYDRIIQDYFGNAGIFTGAMYQPIIYQKGLKSTEGKIDGKVENQQVQSQTNITTFIRRHLVRRFESSFGSFYQSIKNHHRKLQTIQQSIQETEKYTVNTQLYEQYSQLSFEDMERILSPDKDNTEGSIVYDLNDNFLQKEQFLADIDSDLKLLEQIQHELELYQLTDVYTDPKVDTLIESIRQIWKKEPNRKVVIFTEFQDTLRYLKDRLQKAFNHRVLVIQEKITDNLARTIKENFDASAQNQKNDCDIILGTDRISEGLNLNRAGVVINYDIPWNPTRVIQRVGRINRMSRKVFEDLYIYNYFPSEQGKSIVKSQEIASTKMNMIHSILGEDAKIFSPEEEVSPSRLYTHLNSLPDSDTEIQFITQARKIVTECQDNYPEIYNRVQDLPSRVKGAKAFSENNVMVCIKKGTAFRILYNPYQELHEPQYYMLEQIYKHIEADPDQPVKPLSDRFWGIYTNLTSQVGTQNTRHNTSHNSSDKAQNILEYGLESQLIDDDLVKYARYVVKDIQEYGTLSRKTIKRFSTIDSQENPDQINQELRQLQKWLSIEYFQNLEGKHSDQDIEVVIGIENQKI